MEAPAGVAANRAGSSPMSSSRKEWRAVSEHQPIRSPGNEVQNLGASLTGPLSPTLDLERSKLGQSDERTIYEGRQPLDFCTITIDGNSGDDLLEQLQSIATKREDLQHLEIELRAQMIAKSEIAEIQNSFDSQIKEHADAAVKLQEQLHEREQAIHDLERRMEEKDRELIAIKRDNEAAWAKEDLLREQKKELATFRRERDHSDAERMQHLQQIHDLQEHFQDKERQLMDLQEQYRVAQETIIYKDDQLREAQAWIARVQEMDALQSHSLQAELRERTEQCNQLWIGWQRQVAEMERFHVHTIQQLQLELADLRERCGSFTDESRIPQTNVKDVSQFGQINGNRLDSNGSTGNTVALSSDNSGSASSNGSSQIDRATGVPLGSSSLLGLPAYLSPAQVPTLHPFVMHQQGIPQSVPSNVPHSQLNQYQSIPSLSSNQQWQNQQDVSGEEHISKHIQHSETQNEQNLLKSDSGYGYELTVNGEVVQREYPDVHVSQVIEPDSSISSSTGEAQVTESIDRSYLGSSQHEQSLNPISSQFHDALTLDGHQQSIESKEEVSSVTNQEIEVQAFKAEQPTPISLHPANSDAIGNNHAADEIAPEMVIPTGKAIKSTGGRNPETNLLDERSLLACIVRTVPPGGKIRISSTLPNRLGKMLAPLHWHDYKRKYGKLDDFVASHPEYFVIEGDYIQLREGAQEMIAATAAVAKVAAAAAVSAPNSSSMSSVALTPVAQARLRSASAIDSKQMNASENNFNVTEDSLRPSTMHMHSNGINFSITGSTSKATVLSKSKEALGSNGLETKPGQAPGFISNGAHLDTFGVNAHGKGLSNGRAGLNAVGRHPGRAGSHTSIPRR
ncbi:uncharacterized protein LOC115680701 isoform X3 [Syzygium oleosum]|uniref:uncharacterized protein LOC115680701 isoform X3 n=1 Tax=Syzygium oleosum TaxID=219896 RepID=UPI0024B90822|nr:uncharacterized protein LOC115680701 isoform X3 [Syzygium oleosum]